MLTILKKEVEKHRTALREGNNHDKNRMERDSLEPDTAPFFIARKGEIIWEN